MSSLPDISCVSLTRACSSSPSYCAIALLRQASGHELRHFASEDLTLPLLAVSRDIYAVLPTLTPPVEDEIAGLAIQIQARLIADTPQLSPAMAAESEQLVEHLLTYIHQHYPYDLRGDQQLRADLQTHISAMLLRVKYQIGNHNPLADHIKQYYPLAYDITLAAISEWIKQTPYRLTHHEIGYLVIHIGVGLERHYDIGYTRRPQALLLCDAGNATFRVLEARIKREYPQLQLTTLESVRDYEGLAQIAQDFVISTVKVNEKNAPRGTRCPLPDPIPAGAAWQAGADRPHPPLHARQIFRCRPLHGGQQNPLPRPNCLPASVISWRRKIWWRAASEPHCRSGSGSSPPCWEKGSPCPTPSVCWRAALWFTPYWPRRGSLGQRRNRDAHLRASHQQGRLRGGDGSLRPVSGTDERKSQQESAGLSRFCQLQSAGTYRFITYNEE